MGLNIRGVVESRLPIKVRAINQGILKAVQQGLELEGNLLVKELHAELDSQGANVSGDLRKSVNYRATLQGGFALVSVGPGVEHGVYRELGTKPHWAPLDPLLRYVKARGMAKGTRYSLKTRRRMGNKLKNEAADLRAAKALRYHISQHGTKAHPFVGPVFQRERGKVRVRMNQRIVNWVKDANRE